MFFHHTKAMNPFWERGLLCLLVLSLMRLGWLNTELNAYLTRTPALWLGELTLLGGLLLLKRGLRLPLSLGWAAVLNAVLGGHLADESGGTGNVLPELVVGLLAFVSLTVAIRTRHNARQ